MENDAMKHSLPRLVPEGCDDAAAGTDSVLLAVYAPFGTDKTLSSYPGTKQQPLTQHPLVRNLLQVAGAGIHVSALIDRVGENTYLVEIPAGQPGNMRITSSWKEDMSSPLALAGFLQRAHACHPKAAIVLSLEGHGAGYLPEIDRTQLTVGNVTAGGKITWTISDEGSPILPTGSPILPTGSPILPTGSPILPVNHMPLSTWGTGDALRRAQKCGVPKVAVLHFNNCFNMSAELLHTVAPYAEYATGYMNYNFFTAGETYPDVFRQLGRPGARTTKQLAALFAKGNGAFLEAKGNHPTVGASVQLVRMKDIADGIDGVARELLQALRANPLGSAARDGVVDAIQAAIEAAQQYDTSGGGGFGLDTPDELTDIGSLAITLQAPSVLPKAVRDAALALSGLLTDIKRYGSNDLPWIDTSVRWDFKPNVKDDLAMNILLPDPQRKGIWDWRSPYYMDINPNPNLPLIQPHVIDFLKETNWVEFIDEYHKGVRFAGLLAGRIPDFPVFNAKFVPPNGTPGAAGGPAGKAAGKGSKRT
jgi:hypothetical protein